MAIHEWWRDAPEEIYWLEITDRPDLGQDLKAPQAKGDDTEYWSYSLLKHTGHGDIVFHYRRQDHAIVAWSRIAKGWWEDDIQWAAHGTSARSVRTVPYNRSGWKVGLTDHEALAKPVTLSEIRQVQDQWFGIESELTIRYGTPLYLGFTRYANSLRAQQGYLTKLPAAFVQLMPYLHSAALRAAATATEGRQGQDAGTTIARVRISQLVGVVSDSAMATRYKSGDFGADYRQADEQVSVSTRDPMEPDPALVERGNRGHAKAQNALANRLMELGYRPLSPNADEPPYDLAWVIGQSLWLAEAKSLTNANEERQLRLALGQVLRYADMVEQQGHVSRPVIMAEREPTDRSWHPLCERLGVLLLWPERLALLPDLLGLDPDVVT